MTFPRYRQRWRDDFYAVLAGLMPGYQGSPCAFVRYGDGEAAIIAGRKYQTRADGWKYPGGYSDISKHLCNSLCCSLPGYSLGLPSPTYEQEHLQELLPFVRVPYDRITWSKILIDTNYPKLLGKLPQFIGDCAVVGSSPKADFFVPANGVDPFIGDEPINAIVAELRREQRPILVSAGPLSNIIIHRYWSLQAGDTRQTIIDIGSAIDKYLKGRVVRVYSKLKHKSRDWAPFIGGVPDV